MEILRVLRICLCLGRVGFMQGLTWTCIGRGWSIIDLEKKTGTPYYQGFRFIHE